MENDPNLIAVLTNYGCNERSRQVITQPENQSWSQLPPEHGVGTALQSELPWIHRPRIELRFDNLPSNGLMFGTSPACQIQLEKLSNPEHQKEGRIHFRITYDDSGNLVLQDISDLGTVVAYNSQNINEPRQNFIWTLDLVDSENEPIKKVIYIPDIQGIAFQVFVPTHKNCKAEYIRKRQDFLDRRQPTPTPFDHLKAKPNRHTRSGEPVYYKTKKTIKGGFGEVKLVYDLSTGTAYAQKTLFKYRDQTLKALHNEARIMRKLDHRHIVPLRSFTLDPAPTLIMPYYHFGNLKDQNKRRRLTLDEVNILFHQTLFHRVHLTGALTKAGINRKAIAKLRGRKSASRYRVSKKRNYQWNHITLKTAMEFATTHSIKELEQLLLNFIDVLDMLT